MLDLFKDDKFRISDYGGIKKSGEEINLHLRISPKKDSIINEIQSSMENNNLEEKISNLRKEEETIYNELLLSMTKWIDKAKEICINELALQYNNLSKPKSTHNQWVLRPQSTHFEEVSNSVYSMFVIITSDKFDIRVTWLLETNSSLPNRNVEIAGQTNKKFKDEESMLKYVEGRKKAYAHLFTEEYPIVPKEYENIFKFNGLLLPNYRVEE